MTRAIAEQSNALSIFWLKKQGYFPKGGSMKGGTITWTLRMSKSSIGIYIVAMGDVLDTENYMRLDYTHTNGYTDEKTEMDYKVPLTTTPCNFGGVRYWFICPLSKNERYCGRRVGVLYQVGKYWGCRYCADIAYQAQFEGGNFRVGSLTEPDVERVLAEVSTKYYNGNMTRKYKRYLKKRKKMNDIWKKASAKFGMDFGDFF